MWLVLSCLRYGILCIPFSKFRTRRGRPRDGFLSFCALFRREQRRPQPIPGCQLGRSWRGRARSHGFLVRLNLRSSTLDEVAQIVHADADASGDLHNRKLSLTTEPINGRFTAMKRFGNLVPRHQHG